MPRARRRLIAVTAVLAGPLCGIMFLVAPGSGVPAAQAAPALAAVTQVKVIPQDPAPATVDDNVVMAGATGFLHQYNFASQFLWTSYATSQTVTVPGLSGLDQGQIFPAGGDSLAIVNRVPGGGTTGAVSELDLAGMTWQHWTIPAGVNLTDVFGGNSVLVAVRSGGTWDWQVLTFAKDGTDTATTVTGLPAGANVAYLQADMGDSSAAVVRYSVNGALDYGLLDLATAVLAPIPNTDPAAVPTTLSSDSVGFYDQVSQVVSVYSRAGLMDGSDTAATTVTLPSGSGAYRIALAGDHVIAVSVTSECQYCGYTVKPALDVPLSGAAAGQALPQAQTGNGAIAQAPGGAVLAVGGTGPGDWSVRRLTIGGSDTLSDTAVLPLTGPISNGGLSISQGVVRHIEVEPVPGGSPDYQLFNHLIVPDTTPYLFNPEVDGGILTSPLPCTPGGACVRTADGNWYGTSYLATGTASTTVLREQIDANTSTASMSLPSASGTVADAALNYVIVDGAGPARQYVVDVGHGQVVKTGPVTGAALWFGTLWHSDGAGHLRASDLDTGTTLAPVATGANCTASEIQATERWIYWSCGPNGPAGVYDLRARADIKVPAGPMLLGDGYLVQRDAATGDLRMYDVHTGKLAAPVTLASSVPAGPAADGRGITWAVDKYSGDVAYVASDDSVHVVSTGVPATPPVITYPPAPLLPQEFSPAKNGGWDQSVALSRPITSWELTIRHAGKAVHTQSGGAARSGVFLSWNGYLPGGAKAYSGLYTWSLSVTTAGSSARFTVPGSTLVVECGQIPFRSYDCGGASALLADTGGYSGESDWYNGTPSGGLSDNGYTDNWPLCPSSWCASAIVPFGDFNGDGFADLLVRYRSGVLRAYLGFGQSYFNTQVVKSISLGKGWNTYDALAYPGDLTRDGKPDLVARDGKGRLWLFASTGTGKFRARTEISGGWAGYVRLIGAGDLNGDGIGDLLAIDKSGVMWLFEGNGHGGFRWRREVSSGWNRYNAVIGIGDLNNDGCNDLVARDRQGTLWRFDGNCKGGFGKPVKISKGWARYQGLF